MADDNRDTSRPLVLKLIDGISLALGGGIALVSCFMLVSGYKRRYNRAWIAVIPTVIALSLLLPWLALQYLLVVQIPVRVAGMSIKIGPLTPATCDTATQWTGTSNNFPCLVAGLVD